jgi:hypothetical protein
MRDLEAFELTHVSGAGCSPCPPTPSRCPPTTKAKGNNGYGNGGHDGSPNGKQDRTR